MIEAEQADGWTDFRIVGHLMGYLAERAAISDDARLDTTKRPRLHEWRAGAMRECLIANCGWTYFPRIGRFCR